jgi:hypothetical protein
MPFFLRYSNGYGDMDANSTTILVKDSALMQKDGFWNGSWFYKPATQEISLIRAFIANDRQFSLEVPMASTPSAGDDYEIHSIWNAIEIKHAINSAISEVGRIFPETIVDESLVLQENKLDYSVSGFSRKPWVINKIYLENRSNVKQGVLASATSTTFVVENSSILSEVNTNWKISIYSGTGTGQLRAISSVASATGTVSAWTTTPDSTSKYALWDATEDFRTWTEIDFYRTDSPEFPDTVFMEKLIHSRYGMRLHIEYMSLPGQLSAEADTCTIPERVIVPMAISYMHGQRIGDTKVDQKTAQGEADRYRKMAESYLVNNAPRRPDSTVRRFNRASYGSPNNNPLDW